MFQVILKKILSFGELRVSVLHGDQLHVVLTIGQRVVLDRTVDFLPGA